MTWGGTQVAKFKEGRISVHNPISKLDAFAMTRSIGEPVHSRRLVQTNLDDLKNLPLLSMDV
jgi:hypothetical protein